MILLQSNSKYHLDTKYSSYICNNSLFVINVNVVLIAEITFGFCRVCVCLLVFVVVRTLYAVSILSSHVSEVQILFCVINDWTSELWGLSKITSIRLVCFFLGVHSCGRMIASYLLNMRFLGLFVLFCKVLYYTIL